MGHDITGKLRGLFAPLATPFKDNEDFDPDALRHNLAIYEGTGLRGYLVCGSNGEARSLDETEKVSILETVVDAANKRMTVIIGVMYETHRQAERFIRRSADLGADVALVQSPSYFRKLMTDDVLYGYFSGLADEAPIPILIYNCPGFNGITLSVALLERLSEHPNIVGMKDSTPGCDLDAMRLNGPAFHVMAGSINKLSAFVERGSIGGTISLADSAPAPAADLFRSLVKTGPAACADANARLIEANKGISGRFGVPGVKTAMTLMGYRAGIPRRPLVPLGPDGIAAVKSALVEAGVLEP